MNKAFEWQDIFAPERICKGQIQHQIRVTADGIKEYSGKQIVDIVILKDQRGQADCNFKRVITLLMQAEKTKVAPGDRVYIAERAFEVTFCESCCDLSGNVIAWKCKVS